MTRRLILLSTAVLGAAAIATQLVLMRELWEALSGNELVVGITLGSWLLLSGAGASLGRRLPGRFSNDNGLGLIQAALALLPFALILAIRAGRNVLFLRGASVDATGAIATSLLLLAPYCLLSGALLPLLATKLDSSGEDGARALRSVYVSETLGGAVGGVVFSFLLAPFLDPFALLVPFAATQLILAMLCVSGRLRIIILAAALACPLVALGTWGDLNLERHSTALQHPGERVLQQSPSPYGRLVITEASGQFAFYSLGIPWLTASNTEEVEETAHFALSQRPDARRVLLIGGVVAGIAREVLRYPKIETVVGVEQDPAVAAAGRRFAPGNLDDPRLRLVIDDGRRFLRSHDGLFDVIIVVAPDPSSALLNRVHTAEFYGEARKRLSPGGVLAIATGRYANAVSPELSALVSCERKTLESVFARVLLIPGGRIHFLASDGPLHTDIASRIESAGLKPAYVNRHSLDALLAPDRLADLERASSAPAEINRDFNPMLYRLILRHWTSQFSDGLAAWLVPAIGLIALGAFFLRQSAPARMLFIGGFTATTLEMVLLLGYQNLYGTLYRQTGLFVAVFMAGMALGGLAPIARWYALPSRRSLSLTVIAAMLALAAGLIPFVLRSSAAFDSLAGSAIPGQALLLCATFVLAAGIGLLFAAVAINDSSGSTASRAARLFSADLLGAALGAWMASAWLIPRFGFTAVCLFVAALNLLAGCLVFKRSAAS
ncbi:MAG: fused MFS/spermidine synthase [Opitutaceae bacterium]|jgi:spermidine synthase